MVDENKCPVCHGSGAGIDPVFGHPGKCYPCDGTGKDHRTKEGHDPGHCWICSNWKVFGGNETPMRRDQQLDDMIADNRNLSIKLSAAQTEVKLLRDAIDKSNIALAEAVETKEERNRLLLQVHELQDIVRLCVEQGGLSFHVEGGKCPEDDTCDCPDALRVNAAMKGYTEKRVVLSQNDHCATGQSQVSSSGH